MTTNQTDAPPDRQQRPPTRSLGLALLVIAAAQLMIVLDATIVNIALPHIETDLGFSKTGLQWVVTSYALALGSLLLLGGRLGDLFGRRRMFMTGIAVFTLASLLGGLAPGSELLLAARVLQGAGAAMASPAALALINTTFPAGKERSRAMAVYAAMSGAGAAIGLILGGALTEIDWRWTFFVNIPIGLLALVLAPRTLVESEGHDSRLDLTGAALGTAGLFGIVYGLSHAAEENASWGDLATLAPLLGGIALIGAFVVAERRSAHPLLPLHIVADRTRAVSLFAMLSMSAGMFAMFFFIGLYFQQVLDYSPIRSGLAFLPFSFGMVAAAAISSNLTGRVAPRWISGTGGVLATAGMWGFTHLTVDSSYVTALLPSIVVLALGMGLVFIPVTMTATHGVGTEDSGAAASALNTMQQVGGAIGLAALSTVFASAYESRTRELVTETVAKAKASGTPVPANPDQQAALMQRFMAEHGPEIQTYASTQGFWVAAGMLLVGTVVLLAFLGVRAEDMQSDDAAPAHVG